MKKNITMMAVVAVLLLSCNKNNKETGSKYAEMEKASWLIGTWENNSPQGNLSETWSKENDSVYKGNSYFIKGKDTLHHESVLLSQNGNQLVYSPTVKGQNNDQPVAFKMTSITDTKMVFENMGHDFPQRIAYNKVTSDSLVAQISGIQEGKPSSENYPMSRKSESSK